MNNSNIPSTFPGIGRCSHVTIREPNSFSNHNTNNCEIKITIYLTLNLSSPSFLRSYLIAGNNHSPIISVEIKNSDIIVAYA